jgi:GNAT superfamily N-acetyltransferase
LIVTTPDRRNGADPTLVAVWTAGWARSRGLMPPEPRSGGWYVRVGLPEQKARYVLPAVDPEALRSLADRIKEPALFLKICAPRDQVSPLLPDAWRIGPARSFMAVSAAAMERSTSIPAGYQLAFRKEAWGLLATVRDEGGAVAAHGRLVVEQDWAIFDRIETDEAHRRRGLATLVMRGLQSKAFKAGARGGLLVATIEGERLYASLGWAILSHYTSAAIPLPSPTAAFAR